ncbi:D-amino acid dehydrogenase [Pseudoduganella umbonata]|uniref:D-amino acid dehydrogenase n=1 Tax=Pseudoduganella umbonata TaxID=864828 RepID=A0A4P8HNW2_9BURK|nr:D-amino acid dehydrogenase [Pseudoduganella umbonata]MBB3224229.1 D-amino-acid dehydrogenase [Pseudoduganella umbonata]QCP11387.1 D-amino acid dehydrogenase [Pseudoduganella umbonata]
MKHIAVIGAGVTGVTTAYALARRGFSVTVIERHRYPAMETSYANGGQLSASHAEVWNHPSTLRKGLKWMTQPDAPLLLHPAPTWHKMSWLAKFVAAMPRYRDNTVALARLAVAAREHLFAWAADEGIDFDLRREGILHLYRDKAGFDHAQQVSRLLAQAGLVRQAVTPSEMRAIEPALAGNYYGGCYTDSDSSGDIHRFTTGLAAACERLGVRLLCGREVLALAGQGDGVSLTLRHEADTDTQRFDGIVICAGTASRALGRMAGDRIDVYPVKGYSITVHLADAASRAAAPTVSLVDDAPKLVASRFGADRFRVAGTAEFAGFDRDIRHDRIRPLVDWVHREFPGVRTADVKPWAGLRPMMPDLLPKVGRGKAPGVFYNTGHGHLGWTLAAATAEQVARQVEDAMHPGAARSPLAA